MNSKTKTRDRWPGLVIVRAQSVRRAARCSCRAGITLTELVISAVVLMTAMTMVTTLCFQINMVWKDVNQRRVAVNELANQLDRLTRLDSAIIESELERLKVASAVESTLMDPELSGEMNSDELGHRITLRLNWERRFPGKPVELSGWALAEPKDGKPSENKTTVEKPETEIDSADEDAADDPETDDTRTDDNTKTGKEQNKNLVSTTKD